MGKYSTPLKHLEVSRFIHRLHDQILALQQKEYSQDILTYLATRQLTGRPFIEDFSSEPDQIIQIKQLSNALYLAEQVFDQLEKLDLSDKETLRGIYQVREQAAEATQLLLKMSEEVEGAFKSEIAAVASYLNVILSFDVSGLDDYKAQLPSATEFSRGIGKGIGLLVDQLKPASGRLDYDFLTWASSVLPTYIEAARHGIETSAAKASLSLPKVDNKKLKDVLQKKTKKLSNSIQSIINTVNNIKDVGSLITNLPSLFRLPSHFEEMQPLLTEMLQEVDHLDETSQQFVREQLARLKYEVLPNLFAMVDKFEAQMLLEPGRVSGPLMDQIKPLYEMLIRAISSYPKFKFTEKGLQLLKLEDTHFMDLRLAPMREQIRLSKQELHQVDVVLSTVGRCIDLMEGKKDDLPALTKAKYYALLKPYLTLLNKEGKQVIETHLTTEPTIKSGVSTWFSSWFPVPNANNTVLPTFKTLQALLKQKRKDHEFKQARNRAHIKSIYAKANLVLFKHNNPQSMFDLPEKDAFAHRHSVSDGVQFDGNGAIIDKKKLRPSEAWDVYQWYADRLTSLEDVNADCKRLLSLLKVNEAHNKAAFKTSTLGFHPNYMPCLLTGKTVQHQPNLLYVNIEGGALNYEVLQPPKSSPCRLLNMTQVNPQTLDAIQLSQLMGNRDGFILYDNKLFYFDAIQLNVVSPEYGSRLRPIIAALTENELQTIDSNSLGDQKQAFDIIEAEHLRAVCKLYLMPLDEAQKAAYRNCYVWNRERKQLSYIDANGAVQEKIALSAQNQRMLFLFIEKKNIRYINKIDHWRVAEKEDPVFRIITPDAQVAADLAIESSAKEMNIYLDNIEVVHRNNHKNCYVWDGETRTLSYINDEGQTILVNLDRYKNDLSKLTKSGYDLELKIVNPEQERTDHSLSYLIKLIDRKRRADELGEIKSKTKGIEINDTNYRNLTAENIANFISPVTCGLVWVSAEPRLEQLLESQKSRYIRTKYALYYYSKEQGSLESLNLAQPQLDAFNHAFAVKQDIDELSPDQLRQITSITGHTPSIGGHSPGVVTKGSIPLRDLNCPLTELTSISPLMEFLPRVYDKALEQGHIEDPAHSECIRCYGAIQPYLVDAYKDIKVKEIRPFDNDVVNFFSGSVYKASEPRPILSYENFRSKLDGLPKALSGHRKRLESKCKKYLDLVQNKMLDIEPQPIKSIHHHEFSPDVAEYMLSIDPVKRQLNESGKTVFRVKLALEHLKKYDRSAASEPASFNHPEKNLANKHYPWFYPFLLQVKKTLSQSQGDDSVTVARLEDHLKQILFYEEGQIQRNQAIVASFNACKTSLSSEASDPSEVMAFMAHAFDFKPCLMKSSSELEPDELALVWVGNQLSYKFLHYGKSLSGKIELAQLTPLSHLDDLKTLSPKSVKHILSIAYEQRKRDLEGDSRLISFEEALDLSQWYRNILNEEKRVAYEQLAEKTPPEFKPEKKPAIKTAPLHDSRSGYVIERTVCSETLASWKQSIAERFAYLSDSFKDALKPASSGIPFPDISAQNPVTTWALRLSPVINQYTESFAISNLSSLVSLIETSVWGLQKTVPSMFDDLIYTKSPHQVLAYKRIMNIAYFLEQIMLEIEKIKRDDGESKLARVNHLLIGYLYAADSYPLFASLATDPHFGPFFREMLSKVEAAIQQLKDEGAHYAVSTDVDKVDNQNALYVMNVLKMLPQRISETSEAYQKQWPELQASSAAAIANIEKIMKDYSASYPYLRLFFDLPMILGLLNELPRDMTHFAEKINLRIKGDLHEAQPAFFLKIIMEADAWEGTIGLKPGTLSDPLKKIMDELYKGLITPLVLDTDKQVSLLCDPAPMKARIDATFRRELSAVLDARRYKEAPTAMGEVLSACDGSSAQLTTLYRRALPLFKQALNGCNLYVMSLNDAKKAQYKDCFVWNMQHSQLFYIDAEGRPNPQAGGDYYLKSIPVGKPITPEVLHHRCIVSLPTAGTEIGSFKQDVLVKKPTLIKQGQKYYVYQPSSDQDWRITELDSSILSKMQLNFNKSDLLHRNTKYKDMYDDITAKTGLIYPVQLQNIHKMVEFIAKHPRRQDANQPPIYLSESEIKHYILSNSDFVLQKNGVSLPMAVGCCTITLPKIPEKLDDLTLPNDYNAFYVQVTGVKNALYYIDLNSKQITRLELNPERLPLYKPDMSTADKEKLIEVNISKIRKNKLMMHTDFNIIQALTGHTYQPDFISNLDDFVPNQGNINQLKVLATQCKDHYEGLHATARLAGKIAHEQLSHLRQLEAAQQVSNLAIKTEVYTTHFNHRVDALCDDTHGLQKYTLHLLTDDLVDLMPNHLYVAIHDNQLHYNVIDPAGVKQAGCFALSDIACPLKKLVSASELSSYLPQILRITSRRDNRHTRPHSLATEYQVNLRAALVAQQDPIIAGAMIIIAGAMTSDAKTIDRELNTLKNTFNKRHLTEYRQLNAVNKALDEFMAYLKTAEQQWTTRYSLFENDETIRLKRSTIDHLEELASNENDDVSVRINNIKAYLIEEPTLEHLMNFANYESKPFARVFQLVMKFFEVLGFYTPTVVKRVDKLLSAIEGPELNLPRRSRLPFFSETTRNTIKGRANALKPDNEIKPDSPEDDPLSPRA